MAQAIVAVVLLLGVAVLLLVPFHPEAPVLALVHAITPASPPWRSLDWVLVESGGNFALFAVTGAALFAAIRRPVIAALIGSALSAVGETAQLVIPGRVASWADLVTNSLGAATGAAVCALLVRRTARSTTSKAAPDAEDE